MPPACPGDRYGCRYTNFEIFPFPRRRQRRRRGKGKEGRQSVCVAGNGNLPRASRGHLNRSHSNRYAEQFQYHLAANAPLDCTRRIVDIEEGECGSASPNIIT